MFRDIVEAVDPHRPGHPVSCGAPHTGPSTPNHLMLIAGDSPVIDNPPRYRLPVGAPLFKLPSLPASLDAAKLTWGNYGGYAFDFIQGLKGKNTYQSTQFAMDAAAGKLPSVSWVYAPHDASEHPPDPSDAGNPLVGNVTHGMQWTVAQVNAVVKGGLWPSTAIFITWDDWGGWLDHVCARKKGRRSEEVCALRIASNLQRQGF